MDKRVLLVDDERFILEGLTWMFESEELETNAASDRESAVALLDDMFYPVVVTDLCLHSTEEGLALIDHVLAASPRTKIIVFSAFDTAQTEEQLVGRGVSAVLQKPATYELLEAVQTLLADLEKEAPPDDPVDLEKLYLSAHRRLYDIARNRFRLSHDRAEDVVHEAWILFLQKRNYVQAATPWLAGVVANLSRQQLDQTRRRREDPQDELVLDTLAGRSIDATGRLALAQALAQIDKPARTLCRLIAIEGLSYAEASEATGLPVGSIGPTLLRAKKKLRALLSHSH